MTRELAIIASEELRSSLKKQGSDLMLRYGNAENVIEDLVKEVTVFRQDKYLLQHLLDCNRFELPLSLWKKR